VSLNFLRCTSVVCLGLLKCFLDCKIYKQFTIHLFFYLHKPWYIKKPQQTTTKAGVHDESVQYIATA